MQRAICRLVRGTCRKFRENDCPTIATEEVRHKKSKEEFVPPKHSISEALGWTTGLILTYELTHRRRRRQYLFENHSPFGDSKNLLLYIQKCPFAIAKQVAAQPTITSLSIRSTGSPRAKKLISLGTRKSIDTTPFLFDPEHFYPNDVKYSKQESFDSDSEDEGIHFDPSISKFDETRATKPQDGRAITLAEKVTSDLFSALGAFKFLTISKDNSSFSESTNGGDNPMLEALDILEKGAELGSSRALYNIGVAYDRMNETDLSREYYERAADLGHPLASYNVAVLSIQEGKIRKGFNRLKYAAENGVKEAEEIMKIF